MKGKEILVIGGSGFLGSEIIKKLGKQVVNGDFTPPKNNLENRYINLNLLDRYNISNVINKFDIVINCAGQITTPINECLNLNTIGIYNLINALNQSNNIKLYQISTVAVYGTLINGNEKAQLNPETPYACNKAFAEFLITNTFNNKFCIIRIPNIYGEKQNKGIFAYLKRSFLTDRKLHFEHNGDLLRYFLHVEDIADAIVSSIANNINGTYNLTSPDRLTIKELINLVEEVHNIKFDVSFGSSKPIENIDFLDGSMFYNLTNFTPLKKVKDYIKTF
jgi:nucleoside-diphosphate-sugar epimerase